MPGITFVVKRSPASLVNFAISVSEPVGMLLVTMVVCVPVFGISRSEPVGAVNGTVCVTLVESS